MKSHVLAVTIVISLFHFHTHALTFGESQVDVYFFGSPINSVNDLTGQWDETLNNAETDTNFNMSLETHSPIFSGSEYSFHHI